METRRATGAAIHEPMRAVLQFLERQGLVTSADTRRIERLASEKEVPFSELLESERIITEKDLALLLGEALQLPLLRRLRDSISRSGTQSSHTASRVAVAMLLEDALAKLAAGAVPDMPSESARTTMQRCPGCQAEVDDHVAICPQCGISLRAQCSACGKPLDPSWMTCPHCGAFSSAGASVAPTPSVAETVPARSSKAPAEPVRSFRALVVDDDPDSRRIVRTTLERSDLGLTVITAQDADEALALVDLERPDVVILDLSMPGMDGFEMCCRLRSQSRTRSLPVMILTCMDTPESLARGREVGADDFVVKPFQREDFIARIRHIIERAFATNAHPNETLA
jgi:CheY-like chemotaxis protein